LKRVTLCLLGLLLVACGGSAETAEEGPELEPAVRAYSAAYLSGNGDEAHALLTARCRERTPIEELRVAAALGKEQYGTAKLTSVDIVEESGNLARVTYRYDMASIDQVAEPWALEDGAWRNDDC